MAKQSKKYKAALEKVDRSKAYDLESAVSLVKDISYESFDPAVEAAMRLNVDPRKADQNIRGAIVLPHGTGKSKRVVVFAQGEKAKEAEAAGADYVGDDDLVEQIQQGWLDFDAAIAAPDMMPKVGKLGRILGPKGLMPNPKTGTVTDDVKTAVEETKAGKVEYRVDKVGNLHLIVGRRSFSDEQLIENIRSFYETIKRLRPSTVKGVFIKNLVLSTTMSPGVQVDTRSVL